MLFPPKPWVQFQLNLVCVKLTCMGCATAKTFWPGPLEPWERSEGQISLYFNNKVNFINFHTKLCVCFHK